MKANTFPDRLARYLAWLLPRRLVYWSSVRLFAQATGGPWSRQQAVTVVDALARWEHHE